MTGQIKGRWLRSLGEKKEKIGERGGERERMQRRRRKKSRTEPRGLEKLQVLRGLIDEEDGSVVVDLPNLGAQHVFILIELCFHCQGIFGLEVYRNRNQCKTAVTISEYTQSKHAEDLSSKPIVVR
jgi:hypothetical protein